MKRNAPDLIVAVGRGLTSESFGAESHKVTIEQGRELWGSALERFRGKSVLLLYPSVIDRTAALIAARQLVKVAAELRLAIIGADHHINTDKIYQYAQPIPDFIAGLDNDAFIRVVQKKRDIDVHPCLDCIGGKQFIGVELDRERYFLTSEHELIPHAGASGEGINLEHTEAFETRMSSDAIFASFFETSQLDSGALFRRIRQYIRDYIYLPLSEMYDVLTVWVMGTYVHTIFRYYPYIHLNAEKGSGKTQLMDVIAQICFNGKVIAGPDGNSLLRLIKQNRSTIFIDEAESFAGSSNGGSDLSALLNVRFNRSGSVMRSKVIYRPYGPTMLASINKLNDVLDSRAIGMRLLRKTDLEKTSMYRETPEMLAQQQSIRDQLYFFALRYAEELAAAYNKGDGAYASLPHLTNRPYDLWSPLFTIALLVGDRDLQKQIFVSLAKYSQRDCLRKQRRDAEENESVNLLSALQEMMVELKPVRVDGTMEYYDPDAVHFFLQRSGYLASGMQKKALSRLLNRTLEIESVPKAFGELTKRMYAIDQDRMAEYRRRYLAEAVQDAREAWNEADTAPCGTETPSEAPNEPSPEQPEAPMPQTYNELFLGACAP